MNDLCKNFQLKKDIKDFVNRKIKNIKCVEEIKITEFQIEDEINDFNIFNKLGQHKKILQIVINLYNKYEIYKEFFVQFTTSEKHDMLQWNSFLDFDKERGLWKCIGRPEESVVEKALYNYILCFLSIELNMKRQKLSNKNKNTGTITCTFCDEDIPYGDYKCSICDAVVNEMEIVGRNKIDCDNEKEESMIEREVDNEIFLQNTKTTDSSMKHNIKSNLFDEKTDKTKDKNNEVFNKDLDKWKCGRCECMNEYTFINCKACEGLYNDGKWNCGSCTMENSCINNKCEACGENNINKEIKNNDGWNSDNCGTLENICNKDDDLCNAMNKGKEVKIGKEEWKCGRCEVLQMYTYMKCKGCGKSRVDNGLWSCGTCTLINKCKNVMCDACGISNDHLSVIYCQYCKKTKLLLNQEGCNECLKKRMSKSLSNKWQCQFFKCLQSNIENSDYCHNCNIWRYSSFARGQLVKTLSKGTDKCAWICWQCSKINEDIKSFVCTCHSTRFQKFLCVECNKYSDGSSDKCKNLHLGTANYAYYV